MRNTGAGRIDDARPAAVVLFVGAVLGTIGNALHPILDGDISVESFLGTVDGHASWQLLHLVIAVGVVLLAAGLAAVGRCLADTAGATLAALASGFAAVGATIFAIQIGGIDGVVMQRLAQAHASGDSPDAVLATATAMYALDLALLGLVVTIYFGGLFLAFGLALARAQAFAPWMRWLAIVTGSASVVIGPMLFLDVASGFTSIAFRMVALTATVAAFAIATSVLRGTAVVPTTTGVSSTSSTRAG